MKKMGKRNRYIRAAIQVAFFVFAPGLFSAAFAGIRYLPAQIQGLELIQLTPFVKLLLILLAYTIVFGRFFCGYVCAFGTLGDAVYGAVSFVLKKAGIKRKHLPEGALRKLQYVKYAVLALILALCFFGWYGKISMADPWELFASFTAGNFQLSGFKRAALALGLILIGMCLVERFFCQFLCPMGAVFALMPTVPYFVLGKGEHCIKGCRACKKSCPAALELDGFSGECLQCGACIDACPRGNVQTGIGKIRGREILVVAAKAGILIGVCYPWI